MQLVASCEPKDDDEEFALLRFQRAWYYDRSPFKVSAKSRQIGITWTTAAESVDVASTTREDGGMNVYFMTTSQDDARAFILDCAQWIEDLAPIMDDAAETEVLESDDWFTDDNGSAILTFRIDFASGFSIYALPARPARMRGKKRCYAILDEAAQADVEEWLTAAGGGVMWGGRLAVISTYFGTDNHFYKLVQKIKRGEMDVRLHETDIYEALKQGLYRRICRLRRVPWTLDAEDTWVEWLRTTIYPDGRFTQECECVAESGGGRQIPAEAVERCLVLGPDQCTIFEVQGGERPTVWVNNDERGHSSTSWEGKDGAEFEQRLDTMRQWLEHYMAPVLARINDEGLPVYAGLDYGRTTNMSSFILGVVKRSRVREARLIVEMQNVPWPEQDLVQDFMWAGLRNLTGGLADKGGNGEHSAERVEAKTGGLVRAFAISSGWHNPKFTLVEKRLLEQSWLLPRHFGPLAGDLTSLRRVNGKIVAPQRTTTTGRKQRRHADGAFGLALCEQSIGHDGPAMLPPPAPRQVRRIKRNR